MKTKCRNQDEIDFSQRKKVHEKTQQNRTTQIVQIELENGI